MQTKTIAIAGATRRFLSPKANFKQIKKWLLAAIVLLALAFFATPAAGQVTITAQGGTTLTEPTSIPYTVTFSTAQTGLSTSNFSLTGTATGFSISYVSGSGTSYTVVVYYPGGTKPTTGTLILNMVNSTGLSPGVSGLPVSSPAVQVNFPADVGAITFSSSNANPLYAKTGDQINFLITGNYNMTYVGVTAGGNSVSLPANITESQAGTLTLNSSTPQGALSYNWDYQDQFRTFATGTGTANIIFDSQPPTATISAPTVRVANGNGTGSVSYTVTYADANFNTSNLTTSGITLNTTGTATGTVGVSGSGTSYTVTISNISGNGTLGISVGAGYASDKAGNTDAGAGPSSTVTVVPNVSPSIGYAGPQAYEVNTAISPLTPSVTAGTEAFAGGGSRGVAFDYNGNAYAISSSYTILEYPSGGGSAVTAYNANGVVTNVAVAPVSSTTSTLLFGISGNTSTTLQSMDIVGGVVQAPVTIGPIFSGFSPVAATHPASGPDVVAIFTDNNSNINFTARTGGVYSAPAPIANALVTVSATVFAGGSALALNNYQGAVKLAFVGQDNNLYYSIYSGGVWSVVAPWATPNISMGGVTAFALDAQGNVWYSSGTSLYEIAPGSTAGYAVTALPAAASGIAFDISGNIYVNCGTEIEELQAPTNFLVTPALPAGLSMNSTTGVISGTPTALAGANTYTVSATAGAVNLTAPVNIQTITTPTLSYGSAVNATPGTAITPITPTSTSIMAQTYNSTPTTFSSVNAPTGLAVDIAGNVYVAAAGLTLLKYGPGANLLTTFSSSVKAPLAADVAGNVYAFVSLTSLFQFTVFPPGSTTPSYSSNYQGEGPYIMGGAASNASGMAVDGAGDVYVASPSTNAVYEYSNGKNGGANGALGIAIGDGFMSVSGIAADAAGNVYVADAGAGTIDLMPANRSQWTTLASGLGAPASICIDGAGNLYFSDNSANTISELPAGSTTPVLIASGLGAITAVAVDGQGNLYAADNTNNVIDKFSPSGGFFINPVLPPGLIFNGTTGVISGTPTAIVPTTLGSNYTITAYNTLGAASAIQNIAVTAAPPTVAYGTPRFTTGEAIIPLTPTSTGVAAPGYNAVPTLINWQFGTPFSVAVDTSLNVYVADPFNQTAGSISSESGNGAFINYLIQKGNGNYQAYYPVEFQITAVAVDSSANLYVNKGDGSGVSHLTPYPYTSGPPVETVLAGGYAYSLATDRQGNLFGAMGSNVKQYTSPGVTTTVASGFNSAVGLAIDGSGNMFVSDRGNGTLYKVPAGSSTPIAVATGFAVGNSPLAGQVYGRIAADGTGNVFIADAGNGVVKELPAGGGAVATVITNLQLPTGMAVDINGALYVADLGFSQVRKYTPGGGYYISPSLPPGLSFNNSTGVISGTPTAATPVKDYKITAYNASGSTQIKVRFGVAPPSSNLAGLAVSSGSLSPAFATATTAYSVSVPYSSSQTTVTPVTADPNATIAVNGAAVLSGAPSGAIALSVGTNTITIVVIASDHSSTQTYTITVTRSAASSNAQLSSAGIGYVINGGNEEAVVTPTTADPTATVTVNGVAVASGSASNPIPLNPGSNTIIITVTAQNGVTKLTYKITVEGPLSGISTLTSLTISAGTLSPAFTGSATSYTDAVANAIASVTVTPSTTDPNATVTVKGAAVASGTASGNIALAVGNTVIPTIVTAQDGVTTTTYTITVTRAAAPNATLSALKLSSGTLSPGFASGTTSYTASVGNGTTSITVTPTTGDPSATVKVNGTAVTSGTASGAILLNVGSNIITTIVTASDGITTKTYTLTVTRAPSTDAYLANLKVTTATLSPAFAFKTLGYTSSVPNSTSSVTVKPTLLDATATIAVNGTAVANQATSGPIALNAGPNIINIVVTAQDGVTKLTYTLTITRAPSTNDNLSGLKLSTGSITPTFANTTYSYTASESNSTTSITVTPTTSDLTATVTVNGTAVTSGAASAAIALNVGNNTITTTVTAQDGVTTKTFTITVTRAPSSVAALAGLKVTTATLTPTFSTKTLSYTSSVANTASSVTVTPTLADATATIQVNGTAVANKAASGAIALAVGSNTVTILITAQDGVTTATYTITITRAAGGADSYNPGISVTKPTGIGVQNFEPLTFDDGVLVHQAVSPNGDGINDFLQIDNISNYPGNKLLIMNRNGQLIYEASGYDNSSKVFDGHSNKNGQMQLPGIYFYSLDYTINGITKHKTGFIVLKY